MHPLNYRCRECGCDGRHPQDRVAIATMTEQAKDAYLWAPAMSPHAEYLQRAIRRLHEAVEGKTSEQCARAVLD